MSNLIQGFLNIIRFHKLKILAGVLAFFFFLLVLFPFDDVSDLVTAQVAKLTQNQVYLQFSNPGLSLFPQLGLKLENVRVETQFAPPLKAEKLSVAPSIASLLAFKPGLSIYAEDLLGGDVSLTSRRSKMKESQAPAESFSLSAKNLDLLQVAKLARLPVQLKGEIELGSDGEIDITWKEQPSITMTLQGKKIQVPPDTIPTAMGPLNLPDLNFSSIEIEGELKGGKLLIKKGTLGSPSDDLYGTVKGSIDLSISNSGGRPALMPGGYDLQLNINVKEALEKKVALFLIICDSVKKKNGPYINYPCGLSSPNIGLPPKARAL
jgi:type II secretion system protein N